jgi:hypothetical protein
MTSPKKKKKKKKKKTETVATTKATMTLTYSLRLNSRSCRTYNNKYAQNVHASRKPHRHYHGPRGAQRATNQRPRTPEKMSWPKHGGCAAQRIRYANHLTTLPPAFAARRAILNAIFPCPTYQTMDLSVLPAAKAEIHVRDRLCVSTPVRSVSRMDNDALNPGRTPGLALRDVSVRACPLFSIKSDLAVFL